MKKLSLFVVVLTVLVFSSTPPGGAQPQTAPGYASEDDLIEVMFAAGSKARLRGGSLVDTKTNTPMDVQAVLQTLAWHQWSRIGNVSEEKLDEIQARGERMSGKPLYNLNNIYRLRIPKGHDVWALSRDLEALPDVLRARPVPKPVLLPLPADYEPQQNYLDPASFTPTGIDAEYAWTKPGGAGSGVTVCDIEYWWSYSHADVTKAVGSQINVNVADPGYGPDHGTAVIGEMVADNNGWGVTGICYDASLVTCGTYYGTPTPSWDVPGAMAVAIANLQAGDVILLEQQWDYSGYEDYVPIEWWTDYYPNPQSHNAVYAAIENAVANGINVVETGGNGEGDSGTITWYGDSGAIVVGAGGAYTGGTYVEGDLQKLSFSTYGPRFDLQGWGEDVVTTGFGDLYNAEGANYFYTSDFNGTSSAGPIVAGAVACCVGYWKANVSPTAPAPSQIRNLLKTTGTPQVTPPAGNIGPRPDLLAAFVALGATGIGGEATPRSNIVLEQNYPNPLNPETSITYSIPAAGDVALTVYDIRGRLVKRLVEDRQDGGEHTVTWNGRDERGARVASGMYLIRLEAAGEKRVVKAVLLK
jgi:serine protease